MRLEGKRVLLVEDEAIIAMTAEDMLEELGCETAAVASSLSEAMEAVGSVSFDVALLDINLNGEQSLPVAVQLRAAGTPFVFTTGYGAAGCGAEFAGVPLVTKPYLLSDLEAGIRAALGR